MSNLITSEDKKTLLKRARAKYISNALCMKLKDLKNKNEKRYFSSFSCSACIEVKNGKMSTRYCDQRWCLTCNRIRTAKLINGYSKPLKELKEPYFVTLTIPNVKGEELRAAIKKMTSVCTLIAREAKRKLEGCSLRYLRKLETTINEERNDFHPHFHLIVEGYEFASFILSRWLERFPEASNRAQDLRPADENSIYELFKYFTKIVYKDGTNIAALDVVLTAMKNLRTFQAIGIKKINEDIENLQTIIEVLQDVETKYIYSGSDWFCENTGEALTGYIPSDNVQKIVEGFG